MALSQKQIDYNRRSRGDAPNGEVSIRSFDHGVVQTLGAVEIETEPGKFNWFLTGEGVEWPRTDGFKVPPGMPGIPINFSYPEDLTDDFVLPCVVVTFDDLATAQQRWHPGTLQYKAPAPGARPLSVQAGNRTFHGFSRMEQKPQAVPYDLSYTINIHAYRRAHLNPLLMYVLGIYQPSTRVFVLDSAGDKRVYRAYTESVAVLDDILDLTQRTLGYSLTLRIEGELDTLETADYTQATGPVKSRMIRIR